MTGGRRGVLDGAFALLDALSETGELGLTRLAAETGLPKATAYRLLEQLTAQGVVEKCGRNYHIGLSIPMWSQAWRPHQNLLRVALGPMRSMARLTGATVGLVVPSRSRPVLIGRVPGRLTTPLPAPSGTAWYKRSAAGRAVLTPPTNPTRARGSEMIADGSPQPGRGDVVFDREEVVAGVCCAAVSFTFDSDTPVAALYAMVDAGYPLLRLATILTSTVDVIQAVQP
ncbi:helix-turn-helix domain-containing protein [Actinosynnema sp. CS-041913]|uniref:helix-turn-helix domain-containing protein n=1 Tax=Actinosynnema sp. CS-041913 TaxID=3239917 RepID=UPI003D93F4EA